VFAFSPQNRNCAILTTGLSPPLARVLCQSQPSTETVHLRHSVVQRATMNSEVDSFCGGLTLAKNPGQQCSLGMATPHPPPAPSAAICSVLQAQGPSRTCYKSKEEEEVSQVEPIWCSSAAWSYLTARVNPLQSTPFIVC
jgi:hypothetical protein